jgi:SSS family solute:Na+ symporter
MAENMYRAMWSWLACVIVTVIVSLMTQPKSEAELEGLVYGATKIPEEAEVVLYKRPGFWAVIVGVVLVALNIIFW